jgi:hypothetical protein
MIFKGIQNNIFSKKNEQYSLKNIVCVKHVENEPGLLSSSCASAGSIPNLEHT